MGGRQAELLKNESASMKLSTYMNYVHMHSEHSYTSANVQEGHGVAWVTGLNSQQSSDPKHIY